ncbi:hypothetical protein [Pannonibacter phragmitetus]|uniref:hypothetical protein n=1 Tax=Pannonibacter phragmitetus TaxID=121719 RepID=UPI003D2EB0E9
MSIKSLGIRSCLWSESSSVPGATAAGTLVTGPVSFIGILVPHLVTRLGFRGTASQTLAWPWPLSPASSPPS